MQLPLSIAAAAFGMPLLPRAGCERCAAAVTMSAVTKSDEVFRMGMPIPEGWEVVTRRWIEEFVVQLGLCPFASKPFVQETIRYVVSEATDDEQLLEDFFVEGSLLLDVPKEEIATTMLIAPDYAGDIEQFYSLYVWLTDLLESGDEPVLDDGVQPAFFHPEWSFEGMSADSALHYEKRAPCPVVNLLRRADLDEVVATGLKAGRIVNQEIAEHNAAELERTGEPTLRRMMAGLGALAPESH